MSELYAPVSWLCYQGVREMSECFARMSGRGRCNAISMGCWPEQDVGLAGACRRPESRLTTGIGRYCVEALYACTFGCLHEIC